MKSKIRIQIDYTSLLVPIILGIDGDWNDVWALLLAAAIHECGHLTVAQWLHIPIHSLHISILGARLQLSDPLISYRREWFLCAAGPLFSGLGAVIAFLLAPLLPNSALAERFAGVSLALGLINLLPIGWLDGGRMFRMCCYQFFPPNAVRALVRIVSFLFFLIIWMTSIYLLLRVGSSLSLFIFSFSLFLRFFAAESD